MSKLSGSMPLFLYGTGSFAFDVLQIISRDGTKVKKILDHLPRRSDLSKIEVVKPEEISPHERSNSIVVLCIHNRQANLAAIITRLNLLGFSNILTPVDLFDHFEKELGTRYWLTNRGFYQKFQSQITSVNHLWADDVSREIYTRTIQFRISGDYSLLPEPDVEHQYFPPDIPSWKQPVRFVDCGAYHGDAHQALLKHGYNISALAAFEPDLDNFHTLTKQVRESNLEEINLWPCGVYSSTTQLRFATGQGEASGISEQGQSFVQCIALDDAIPNFQPTLIKMDIEGAEIQALHGAQNLIQRYKPGLAISVYHAPEHIWEIPLLLEEMLPGVYQYYLRAHAYNDFDTVLYAIPIKLDE